MEKSQVVAQIEPTTVFPLWNAGFQRLLLLLWGVLTTKTAQTTIASGMEVPEGTNGDSYELTDNLNTCEAMVGIGPSKPPHGLGQGIQSTWSTYHYLVGYLWHICWRP